MRPTQLWPVAVAVAALTACAPPSTDQEAARQAAALTREEVQLIPRQSLLGNPEKFRGRISPDGSMVSFLAPVDGVQNVWVAPTGDQAAARPVTRDTLRGIRLYFWAADGEHLLYIQDEGGNENWQLHAVHVETAEDRNLTPIEGVQAQFIGGSYSRPKEVLVGLNDRDPKWHDPYRIHIESGERSLVESNDDGFAGYAADQDLSLRMAVKNTPDGGSELFRRSGSGGWETLTKIPPEDAITTGFSAVTADGKTAYGVDSRGRDKAALVALDLASGETTVLGSDDRADVQSVLTHPETGRALAYAVDYTGMEWFAVADEVKDDIAAINERFGGYVQILGQTRANDRWILYSDEPDAPGHYYAFDRVDNSFDLLFNTRPALDGYTLAGATAHVIPARDGLELVSYLTLPAWTDPERDGVPAERLPMVLLVHGGPWSRDAYSFSEVTQMLANRGYAVLQVNFRGSTGFGKSFVNAGDLEWGRAMHQDLLDGVAWAVDRGVAIPDKVAIMGGSYGGYATLAGLTFSPEAFAAGVDIVGPSNLETLIASIPPYWTSLLDLFYQRVGDPRTEEGRAFLAERSPLTRADQIVRPLLIGQGANDPRVKKAESDQIVEAMTAKGLPVTYVLFPDEGHGFARPENGLAFHAITEAFLAARLGGRYEPMTAADLDGSSIEVPVGAELVPGLAEALAARAPRPEPAPAASGQ